MSSSRYFALRGAWALLLALLLVAPVAADYLRYYRTGLDAMESGDWNQVDEMMRRALELRSEETRRRLRRGSYFPHFYLGLARYHLGDCPGALASWAESESQGVIVGRDEYSELRRLQADCKRSGAPSLRGKGTTSAKDLAGKKTLKEKVRTGQHVVERGADPTRKALGAVEQISPDSDLGKVAREGQKTVDALETATDVIDVLLPPKARLEAAIDAYFVGKPKRTLQWLEGIDMSDPRGKCQVYLFRAAASYRLYLLGAGESHLATARENADRFQQEQWRKDFPTELFDPRFVSFVRGRG